MSIFEYIKARVTIRDVVGEYTTLKPAGAYVKGRCPFHNERTASFTVTPHREIFYCFGCHEGGDVISFVAKAENCSPLEAARLLAQRYNIELPSELSHSTSEQLDDKKRYLAACNEVAAWCRQALQQSATARRYLAERDFTQEVVDRFELGFFPNGPEAVSALQRVVQSVGLLARDLTDAHILSRGRRGLYSPFEGRIIFPIRDQLGQCCGFGGRVFQQADKRCKYYNSRESDFFQKGTILFGLDLAKDQIKGKGRAFLVEGYTDCIAMAQYGFGNVVATLGTACTVKHLQALSRYARDVCVLYDGDAAGERAILRLATLCWQADLELKVVAMPPGQDPASFLAGGGNMAAAAGCAKEMSQFFVEKMEAGFGSRSLGDKVACLRQLLEVIAGVDDPLKRDILLQRAAASLSVPIETLREELGRAVQQSPIGESGLAEGPAAGPAGTAEERLRQRVFCAILDNAEVLDIQNINYLLRVMPEPMKGIVTRFWKFHEKGPGGTFSVFFEQLDGDDRAYVTRALAECGGQCDSQECEQLFAQWCRLRWKHMVRAVRMRLAKSDGDDHKARDMLAYLLKAKQEALWRCGISGAEGLKDGTDEKNEYGQGKKEVR